MSWHACAGTWGACPPLRRCWKGSTAALTRLCPGYFQARSQERCCELACVCRYLENVPSIVPLLEREYRSAAKRLEDTQEELNDLHPDKCGSACQLPLPVYV